ncbi:MAG: T9SS type A sorting domain-containing protein [Saprospiraceae bacterium]
MKSFRTSLQGAALVLGILWSTIPMMAQTCQLEHALDVGATCPEGNVLRLRNPTMECYNAVRLILENGTFAQWEANTAQGWQVEVIADNELLVTNTNGFLPMTEQMALTFWHYRPGGLPDKVFLQYDDQCTLEGCEWTYDLPGCGEGAVSGIVYRECDEQPYMNQPGWPEAVVQLEDDQGALLQEAFTDASGNYALPDLPPGQYIIRLMQMAPKEHNIPKDGSYVVDLLPGQELDLDFGACPQCSCDDWEILLSQEPVQNDTAFVDLAVYALWEPCRYRMHIAIDSGEIVGVTPPLGWEALIIDPLHAELTVISEEWWNQMNPDILQSSIAVDYGIQEKGIKMTVTIVGDGNAMPEPMCMDSIILEDPTKYVEYTCCPDGKTAGPELVVDGQFVGPGLPASDYTPWVSGPTNQGEIAIFNMNGAYAANNSWVCPGFGGAADTYLAVDGHGTPNQAAWKQQIAGLTAGAEYQFCALVANLVSAQKNFDDPVIILEIVDDINPVNTWQSAPLIVPESPKQWLPHTLAWTAPSPVSTSYTIRILSTVQDAIGNDFALDRVSFRECITVPPDTCCKDLAAFCADLDSLIVFDPDSCKVTMDLGALPLCYTIEWVDWGQGPEFGPWTSSTFPRPMHTFSGNGTYPISYLAIAYNDSNFICIEKIVEDTIEVLCEPCLCNDPMMTLQLNGVDYPLTCAKGAPLVQLPCPAGDLTIFGFFGCEKATGDLCEETVVNYTLTGPNGIVNSGSTTPFPSLIYPAALVSDPGTYSLTLSTLCPGQTDSCLCTLQWLQPDCDTCYCGGFSDMFIRTHAGLMNQPVACGDSALILPCPDPGMAFQLTGVFACVGDSCAPDHQIDWLLTGPGGSNGGSFNDNDPYFGISLLPNWFSQPGLYTLSLQGVCDGDTCICEMSFQIDCPDLCPCDIDDILQLSQDVSQGFAVALANKSCKACFSPLAISDCETVEWWINAISGPPVGTTSGAQTFCTQFAGSGTYTVIMVVTRIKPDGSICEVFTHSQTVQVNCGKWPVCATSLFPNPGLNEGSVAGILGDDGVCPGWVAGADFPRIMEGAPESGDGWSVLLTGCFFNSDVLQSAQPICIAKQPVTASARLRTPTDPIPGADIKVGRKPPGGNLTIHVIEANLQAQRYRVTLTDLLPLEDDDWYEVTIPMDLTNWVTEDSCGDNEAGVSVHLAIEVDNLLSNNQGEGIVREAVLIDHLCLDGELVAIDPVPPSGVYRVWPNPGREIIRVELPDAALSGTRMRLVNLTGQTVSVRDAAIGLTEQTVDTAGLPPGMYYLVIERNGMTRAILRWVCQE